MQTDETSESTARAEDASTADSGTGSGPPEEERKSPQSSVFPGAAKALVSLLGSRGLRQKMLLIITLLLFIVVAGALVYLCWIRAIPLLWSWGFGDWSIAKLGKSILAIVGMLYLVIIPFLPLGIGPRVVIFLEEVSSYRHDVKTAREAQQNIEQELSDKDPNQIVLVLRYSRELLGEYYALGMHQAQRSYRYALIAMWLGFLVLLAGVANQLGWLKALFPEAFKNTDATQDNTVVLLAGTVMEFIAAAFLWVYRTSTQQLIYFYRRQFMLHRTLLATRMAKDMAQRAEEATLCIIQKLVEEVDDFKTDAAGGGGFSKLLRKANPTR
jgi:hypothetical protein